jgi:hypothetical protein
MNTVLSLDLGTATGWAIAAQDGSITSGTESFKPHRFEGGGMRFTGENLHIRDLYPLHYLKWDLVFLIINLK